MDKITDNENIDKLIKIFNTTYKNIPNDLPFSELVNLARRGIKITHTYFMDDEYLTVQGNLMILEDNNKIFIDEFFEDKPSMRYSGWSIYKERN